VRLMGSGVPVLREMSALPRTDWADVGGGEFGGIAPGPRDLKYRFQWNAPIILSPHEPGTLCHGSQHVLRSPEASQTCEEASPDLPRNDNTRHGYSGGPVTHEFTGVETYTTIFYVVESPHEAGTMWVGTDDGLVHITRNSGAMWEDVTPKGIPEWIRINVIDGWPHDKATAYTAATMYQFDGYRPNIYKTNDYGRRWTKTVNGIPTRRSRASCARIRAGGGSCLQAPRPASASRSTMGPTGRRSSATCPSCRSPT